MEKISITGTRVFLFVFFLVVAMGMLLQLALIPISPWHAGNGLLMGGDWVSYHALALNHSEQIDVLGWSYWNPRVNDQAPAGVAAAFYHLFSYDRPLVLLPLHALLFALSATSIFNLFQIFGFDSKYSIAALVPFFAFPSSAMIWGQMGKDVYSLLGFIVLCGFWVGLPGKMGKFAHCKFGVVIDLLCVFAAVSLILFVRPHLLEVLVLCGVFCAFLSLAYLAFSVFLAAHKGIGSDMGRENIISYVFVAIIAILVHFAAAGFVNYIAAPSNVAEDAGHLSSEIGAGGAGYDGLAIPIESGPVHICPNWTNSSILPDRLEARLERLSCTRSEFATRYTEAGSNIDVNVEFLNVWDILTYLPRALQVAFLSPFPNHWFSDGAGGGSQIMRAVAGFEMIYVYFCLLGIVLAILRPHLRLPTILALCFTSIFVLIHVLVIANVGTIYRMRYPAMIIWVCFGVLGWVSFLRSLDLFRKG